MKDLKGMLLLVMMMAGLGCGESVDMAQQDVEESEALSAAQDDDVKVEDSESFENSESSEGYEELITNRQGLSMNLNFSWASNDRVRVLINFPSWQQGNEPYKICLRPKGTSGWSACYDVFPDSRPNAASSVCNWAGECQTTYSLPAVGGCGDFQEVRIQEGYPPFYREVSWASLSPCGWIDGQVIGTFVGASGGYPAGCQISPSAPAGTTGFTYQGHFYHTPSSPGYCPLDGSTFDGANCKVRSIPREPGFVRWPGDFLYNPYNCN